MNCGAGHLLNFRWIKPAMLAAAAAERRERFSGWLMPPRLLPDEFNGRTLAWMAPRNSETWRLSLSVSNSELDLVEAVLVAQAGQLLADVWRVHVASARLWQDSWDAGGFQHDGTIAVPQRHLENLLRALDQISERALQAQESP